MASFFCCFMRFLCYIFRKRIKINKTFSNSEEKFRFDRIGIFLRIFDLLGNGTADRDQLLDRPRSRLACNGCNERLAEQGKAKSCAKLALTFCRRAMAEDKIRKDPL